MAAKYPQETSSLNDKEDVSLQVHAGLSEKNKASVSEDHDASTKSATEDNDLGGEDHEENPYENTSRHGDATENDENIPPALDLYLENGSKMTDDEWEKIRKITSVQACLYVYDKNDVKLAILKLVKDKGYFPADTKAAGIVEHISDGM